MMENDEQTRRALERIANCHDLATLRGIANNAKRLNNTLVENAALRKLYAVSPDAEPGTLEHDVWQSILALEGALTNERGKTTRLSRTRQKIAKDGEAKTVSDLIVKPASEGFHMLLARNWPELTFEAVALRHPERFDADNLASAQARLEEFGVCLNTTTSSVEPARGKQQK